MFFQFHQAYQNGTFWSILYSFYLLLKTKKFGKVLKDILTFLFEKEHRVRSQLWLSMLLLGLLQS